MCAARASVVCAARVPAVCAARAAGELARAAGEFSGAVGEEISVGRRLRGPTRVAVEGEVVQHVHALQMHVGGDELDHRVFLSL